MDFIISDSGGVEDEDALQSMNLNEKKDLMRGIQQSKEASSSIVSCILDLLAYRQTVTFPCDQVKITRNKSFQLLPFYFLFVVM